MKTTIKPYHHPRLSIYITQLYAPLCFDVNTSQVEEVEEGEVGARIRPDDTESSNDSYGTLYKDKGLW
ncbi:MAG: hypothetical protein Q4E32_08735 [Bacteroidales bacterium]|nr:hypothetical protein [Bacteroidales bacterium]